MKTSELKRIVEENGYEFKMNANGIDVFINTTFGIYFYTQDGDSIGLGDGYRIKHHKAITITKALLDYIQTPISEREDEKKYRVMMDNPISAMNNCLTLIVNQKEYYFSAFYTNHGFYQRIFTQQEIDNFPAEIKGAIECGFLKKVEVDQTNE